MNSSANPGPAQSGAPIVNANAIQRKIVGKVSPEERDEILALYERKNGLNELFRSLSPLSDAELKASAIYERIVSDMSTVATRFQKWWETTSRHYAWESAPGQSWEINFETGDIYLRKQP